MKLNFYIYTNLSVAGLNPVGNTNAVLAQLVEYDFPKVGVAGSCPVYRSKLNT